MRYILKRELGFYYKNMFGWFFAAVLLAFGGIYTVILNCNMGYANFEYTINNMSFMYLIIIPILTMRSVAEEKKQKTDQLLYSLPISMWDVALGKYLAMLIVLLVPIAVLCFYPLFLVNYGAVSVKTALLNMAAFYMLGAALIAVGLFISSLTENQAIAAALSFAVFLVTYFGKNLTDYIPGSAVASLAALLTAAVLIAIILFIFTRNIYIAGIVLCLEVCVLELMYRFSKRIFEGLFSSIVENISVFERFYIFARGVFDLKSIVYFASIAVFFLYLTLMSFEKRRWS